jgi:hypothetical protein
MGCTIWRYRGGLSFFYSAKFDGGYTPGGDSWSESAVIKKQAREIMITGL